MKTAFILAAGRGERLKPLTNFCPKALCEVQGKPLIVHHLERLQAAGFTQIIINHAHLGGKIRHFLGKGQAFGVDIIYSPEPPGGLETGGGIKNALPLFDSDYFAVINADIFTDYDFATLNLAEPYLGLLVLTPKNSALKHHGDFGLSSHQEILNTDREYTFAGIALYQRSFFITCPIGRYSITPFLRLNAEKKLLKGHIHTGVWFDIGSPERLKAACQTTEA
jgi:MurNAc alpha-1-phosphate uridylyltransferase